MSVPMETTGLQICTTGDGGCAWNIIGFKISLERVILAGGHVLHGMRRRGGEREQGEGGAGALDIIHGRGSVTKDPSTPLMPGTEHVGFYRSGRHCLRAPSAKGGRGAGVTYFVIMHGHGRVRVGVYTANEHIRRSCLCLLR